MRSALFTFSHVSMAAFAWCWPLDVYGHLPFLGISLPSLLAAALIGAWTIDWMVTWRPRVPFELAWPALLIAAIPFWFRYDEPWRYGLTACLFLSVVHFARDRSHIIQWIRWSAFAGLLVALTTLLFRAGVLLPTAYVVPTSEATRFIFSGFVLPPGLAFAHDLTQGTAILAVIAVLWIALAIEAQRSGSRMRHVAYAISALMLVVLAMHLAGLGVTFGVQPAPWIAGAWYSWIVGGLCLWLLFRVISKVLVARERGANEETLLLLGPLTALAVVLLFTELRPMLWHGFVAGLAAASTIRDKRPAPSVRLRWNPAYVAGLLLLLNLFVVDPKNERDGRNYDTALQRDYVQGNRDLVEARIAYWERLTGGTSGLSFWRARLALDADRPELAAAGLTDAIRRKDGRVISANTPTGDFAGVVDDIRDMVSAMPAPERGLAYERALVASGAPATALSSLSLRIGDASPVLEPLNREPLTQSLSFLLGSPDGSLDWAGWDDSAIMAAIRIAGGRIERAPPDVDRALLPLAVAVRRDLDGVCAFAMSMSSRAEGFLNLPSNLGSPAKRWPDLCWRTAALPWDTSWQVTLLGSVAPDETLVSVTLHGGGGVDVFMGDSVQTTVPDAPAIFVWLP